MDGATAWDKSTVPFLITSVGTIGAVSRTVRITATSPQPAGFAGIFAITTGVLKGNPIIAGSLSTDGLLDIGSNSTITGTVYLDGPNAGWSSSPPAGLTVVHSPNPVYWASTVQAANTLFPNSGATAPGGLSYLALHNDNATASPPITGNSININSNQVVTLVGKPGGANYYLTTLNTNGQSRLSFDNRLGPITIWCGPAGGTQSFKLNGGAALISQNSDQTKAVRIYIATSNGITLTGNSELDAGVYDVVGGSNSVVNLGGTAAVYNATIVTDNLAMNGTPNVSTPPGYFIPLSGGTYQFSTGWTELNSNQ
jgi:hypothetical protein